MILMVKVIILTSGCYYEILKSMRYFLSQFSLLKNTTTWTPHIIVMQLKVKIMTLETLKVYILPD